MDDFWRMTYREVYAAIDGWTAEKNAQAENDYLENVALAWWVGQLMWSKKPQKLSKLIEDEKKAIEKAKQPQPQPTREEIAEAARRKGMKVPGG